MVPGFRITDVEEMQRSRYTWDLWSAALNSPSIIQYMNNVVRNFNMTSGSNYGQWDPRAIQLAFEEKRPIHQYNIIQQMVNRIQGVVLSSAYNLKFIPSVVNPGWFESNLMTDLWDYDWFRGKFEKQVSMCLRDIIIHTGVMEAFIDYTHDPRGNPGFRAVNPNSFVFEPTWVSDDIKDCNYAFRSTWMSPREIYHLAQQNQKVTPALLRRLSAYTAADWQTQDALSGVEQRNVAPDYVDSQRNTFRVITMFYMQDEKRTRVFKDGKAIKGADFWTTNMQQYWVTRQSEQGYTVNEDIVPVCYTRTIIPGLGYEICIQEGIHNVQLGHLPFFVGSPFNFYGDRVGRVDGMVDPQIVYNKRIASESLVIDRAARQNWMYETDTFNGDVEAERHFKENLNATGQAFKVGSGKSEKIKRLENQAIPRDLQESTDRTLRFIEDIVGINEELEGQSGTSRESLMLFEIKREQAESKLVDVYNAHKSMLCWMGEAYQKMAVNYASWENAQINNPETGVVTQVNAESGMNKVGDLPRFNVIVTPSKRRGTRKRQMLALHTEMQSRMTNPFFQVLNEIEMIEYLPMDEDKKREWEKYGGLYIQLLTSQMENQITQNKLQATMAMQQAGGGMPRGEPQDPRSIGKQPGAGPVPGAATLAGGPNAMNNAPSDMSG